jgi:hypothetical protein
MTPNRKARRHRTPDVECTCHLDLSIVCRHVLSGERPVLMMWRDREDGTLGLACGKGDGHLAVDDWAMAHPFHFMTNDPAMNIMRTLPGGGSVERDRVGAPWRRRDLRP